jgi:hypothetical protein
MSKFGEITYTRLAILRSIEYGRGYEIAHAKNTRNWSTTARCETYLPQLDGLRTLQEDRTIGGRPALLFKEAIQADRSIIKKQ